MSVATKALPPAGPRPLPESGRPTTPPPGGVGVFGGWLVPKTSDVAVTPGVDVAAPGVEVSVGVGVGLPGVDVTVGVEVAGVEQTTLATLSPPAPPGHCLVGVAVWPPGVSVGVFLA